MTAVWLRSNRRALWLGMVLPATVAVLGAALAGSTLAVGWRAGGGLVCGVGLALVAALAWQLRQPRLAYLRGQLLVYLGTGQPVPVPIEAVECFFLGKGPAMLAGDPRDGAETSNVVVRLAESASEFAERSVKPALGKWCGGYITLRGTWCEPLSLARVNQLNDCLRQAQAEWSPVSRSDRA